MMVIQIEAAKYQFFRVIGQLLVEAEKNCFGAETVQLLAEIKSCLNNSKLTEDVSKSS